MLLVLGYREAHYFILSTPKRLFQKEERKKGINLCESYSLRSCFHSLSGKPSQLNSALSY
jgi:hypothetical protein